MTLVKDQFHESANDNSVTLLGYARNSMKNFARLFSFQSPSEFTLLSMPKASENIAHEWNI